MTKNNNISNCGIRVFDIYKALWLNDVSQKALLKDFSPDSLLFYINTLKQLSINIKHPTKKHPFYQLENRLDFIDISAKDFKFLIKFKNYLSENMNYTQMMNFNTFLIELTKYVNNDNQIALKEIANSLPLRYERHNLIKKIENSINKNNIIQIKYLSGKQTIKTFLILPQFLQFKNDILYLWGKDNSLNDIRCLRVEKILSVKNYNYILKDNVINQNEVYLKFNNSVKYLIENDKEIQIINSEIENNLITAKFYFKNQFDFIQKVLSFGQNCKIDKSTKLSSLLKEKLLTIKEIYEK